uniref:Tyrosine-protein kinase receptor n=1 Tax=Sycon raphanus TaxID=56443 RepID=Q9GRH2_9METZ|nr:tyrosine kinase [Sycon raphanus]
MVSIPGYMNYNLTATLPYPSDRDAVQSCTTDETFNFSITAGTYSCTLTNNSIIATSQRGGNVTVSWNRPVTCLVGDGGSSEDDDAVISNQITALTRVRVCHSGSVVCGQAYLQTDLHVLDRNECEDSGCGQDCMNVLGRQTCPVSDMRRKTNINSLWHIAWIGVGFGAIIVALFLQRRRDKRKFEQELAKQRSTYSMPIDLEDYVEDPAWELVPDSLTMIREVGEGAFGKVYEGLLATVEDGDMTVAIKTLSVCDTMGQRNAFLAEASIMKKFDSPYVMRLMGLVSTENKPLVVMEFMAEGDLRGYVRKCRPQNRQFSINSIETNGSAASVYGIPTAERFMLWALQLSKGMAYVHEKHFVHRDLAARNCMLSSNLTLKIGDFGFTRDIYESDYYRKTGKGALPVRWMGPEALRDGMYIPESDVWSYGVVLWEMATLGDQPYKGKSNEEVISLVIAGDHMPLPITLHDFPQPCLDLMETCWQFQPAERPTFEKIVSMLDDSPYQDPLAGTLRFYSVFHYGRVVADVSKPILFRAMRIFIGQPTTLSLTLTQVARRRDCIDCTAYSFEIRLFYFEVHDMLEYIDIWILLLVFTSLLARSTRSIKPHRAYASSYHHNDV